MIWKLKKLSLINILEYILALLIILEFDSVYSHIYENSYNFDILASFILIVLMVISFKFEKKILNKMMKILIAYYCFAGTFILLNFIGNSQHSLVSGFVLRFLIFIPAMFIYLCKKSRSTALFFKISSIVVAITTVSLFIWVVGSQLKFFHPTETVTGYWGDRTIIINSYFNIYFEPQTIDLVIFQGVRNCAIFIEAPKYVSCLVFALIIEIFFRKKVIYSRIAIIITGIISTFSVTGIVLILVGFVLKFVQINWNSRDIVIKFAKYVFTVLSIVGGSIIVYSLFADKTETISYSIRIDDYQAGFKAWMESPIYGNGYGDRTAIEANMNSSIRNNNYGFSNSLFDCLSQGGIMLFLIYLFPMFSYFSNSKKRKEISLSCVAIMIGIMFSFIIFTYKLLMLMFLSYGLSLFCNYDRKEINA